MKVEHDKNKLQLDGTSIASLAPEIFVLIFEHGHSVSSTSFSHLVSSVCRYWRNVALGVPSLWSPVLLKEGHSLDLARIYLERSKAYPVDIIVDWMDESYDLQLYRDNLIVPHLHHCRSLSIEGHNYLIPEIVHLGSRETPHLERLEISSIFPPFDVPTLDTWLSSPQQRLFDAPNLRTLRLDMVPLGLTEVTRCFCLENITNFWFKWDPMDANSRTHIQVTRIIHTMPKLCDLTLSCEVSVGVPAPLVLLDKFPGTLTTLELNAVPLSWDTKCGNWLLRNFSSLKTFKFGGGSGDQPTDTAVFSFLRLTPHLSDLYVDSTDFFPHDSGYGPVVPVCLPHLMRLTLYNVGQKTIQAFLKYMTAPALTKATFTIAGQMDEFPNPENHDPVVPTFWSSCPNLEHITLNNGCTLARSRDLVAALRILKHLKGLHLRGRSQWDDELLTGLGTQPWVSPGLEEVSLFYVINFTQDALEAFVRARKRGFEAGQCATIRTLRMRGCGQLKPTQTLEENVDEVWHRI